MVAENLIALTHSLSQLTGRLKKNNETAFYNFSLDYSSTTDPP